jgi:hypothetical protein
MPDRTVLEVTFLLMTTHTSQASNFAAEFLFPLIQFESEQAALLIPFQAAHRIVADFPHFAREMENGGCAEINIPYHPETGDFIYNFRVFVTWKLNHEPALAEMLLIDRYKERLYERYSHIAVDIHTQKPPQQ